MGIRPEHVISTVHEQTPYRFSATVSFAEHLGHTNYLYLDIGRESMLVVESREGENIATNQSVSLAVDATKALLFDQQGLRVR
ncbi:TOBE domain-containing protein [Vibrio sp. PP-XX7]